jgi:transposase
MANIPVQTRVSPDSHTQIARVAKVSGKTKAEVVRDLIDTGLSLGQSLAQMAEEIRRLTQEIQRLNHQGDELQRRMDLLVPIAKAAIDGSTPEDAEKEWRQTE